MGVIHFRDLDDLVAELEPGQVVRVDMLQITEGTFRPRLDVDIVGIGVHVRAFNADGHILSCYIPVARVQMMGHTPLDKGYDEAWERAEGLAKRVVGYLADRGFDPRPGLIDLGDARPLAGGWSGYEGANLRSSPE